MSVAITFGSVGDIIATVQIAAQLLQALSSSRGPTQEFQELVIQLRTFHRCLDHLLSFCQTRQQCSQLETLSDLLLPVIKDSQGQISTFLDTIIKKYGKSLSHSERSRRSLRDMGKMIQWHMFEGDAIKRLNDKLRTSNTTITLVQMNAQGIAEETNKAIVNEKLSELIKLENTIEEKLDSRFDELISKVDEQTTILARIHTDVGSLISAVGPVANMSRECIPLQQPVFFEDSVGRMFKIPLDLINSWKALGVVLYEQFSGLPGQELVYKGRYVVQDAATGRDISPRVPFNAAVRTGQTLHMAMLFHSAEQNESVCPRCRTVVLSSSDMDVECSNPNCKMVFRRVTDISNLAEDTAEDQAMYAMYLTRNQDDGEPNFIHLQDDASERLLEWGAAQDTPEVFKRVRFITQWFDAADSRGDYCFRVGQLNCWRAARSALPHQELLLNMSLDKCRSRRYHKDAAVIVTLVFCGITRQNSVPVFVIYSKSKENRERMSRAATRELPWFRAGSIRIATCYAAVFRESILRRGVSSPDFA